MEPRSLIAPGSVRGEFWHRADDGRVVCDLCPRGCRIGEGQRGFCYVRGVQGGVLQLMSYGRASGFCLDPIEKKPLHHFYPGSSVLSFGTAGCNLGCKFCQNWDISKARDDDRLMASAMPEDIAAAAQRESARSVAFTYNDPVIFAEYAIDTAHAAHELGLKAVAVTAGYITAQARPAFFAPMDAANVDLKAFSEGFYEKLCFAHLGPVLETLAWLRHETKVWLEVTTLLIPGLNDSDDELTRLSEWLVENVGPETPLHLTAFHPDYRLRDVERTPARALRRARERAQAAGLRHVYTGNVHDRDGSSTYCTGCGVLLIERNWYHIGRYALDAEGRCLGCSTPLAGHFGVAADAWGPRRVPLSIHPSQRAQEPSKEGAT